MENLYIETNEFFKEIKSFKDWTDVVEIYGVDRIKKLVKHKDKPNYPFTFNFYNYKLEEQESIEDFIKRNNLPYEL